MGLLKTLQEYKDPQQNWMMNAAGMQNHRLKGIKFGRSHASRAICFSLFSGGDALQ